MTCDYWGIVKYIKLGLKEEVVSLPSWISMLVGQLDHGRMSTILVVNVGCGHQELVNGLVNSTFEVSIAIFLEV